MKMPHVTVVMALNIHRIVLKVRGLTNDESIRHAFNYYETFR